MAADHLVEHDTEREDVGTLVDGAAIELLGSHVARRADHDTGVGRGRRHGVLVREIDGGSLLRRARQLRDPEIEDLGATLGGQEDVVRLDVAMDDARVVRRGEPARDICGDLDRLTER